MFREGDGGCGLESAVESRSSVSRSRIDQSAAMMEFRISMIRQIPIRARGDLQDEINTGIVRALAIAGHIDRAREEAQEVDKPYWQAEAWLAIALASHESEDEGTLRSVMSRINSSHLRDDILDGVGRLTRAIDAGQKSKPCSKEAFEVLSNVLSRAKG